MMKIIGIDPGLSATGIGIVKGAGLKIETFSYGSIHTTQDNSLAGRLNHIFSELITLLQNEAPNLLVIEDVFSLKKYPKSGIALGRVSGVVLLAGYQAGIQAVENPTITFSSLYGSQFVKRMCSPLNIETIFLLSNSGPLRRRQMAGSNARSLSRRWLLLDLGRHSPRSWASIKRSAISRAAAGLLPIRNFRTLSSSR